MLHQKAPHVYLIWQLASIWGAQLHFHIAVQSVWKKSKTLICIYRGSYITRQKLLHLVLIPSKKTLSIDDFLKIISHFSSRHSAFNNPLKWVLFKKECQGSKNRGKIWEILTFINQNMQFWWWYSLLFFFEVKVGLCFLLSRPSRKRWLCEIWYFKDFINFLIFDMVQMAYSHSEFLIIMTLYI